MPCERLRRADGAYTSESESALFSKQLCVFTVILSPDSTEQPRDGGGGGDGSEHPQELREHVSFSRVELRGLAAILLIMPMF